jgi:Glycosyl transferase family 2
MRSIGIAVPCYRPHLAQLHLLLQSIAAQSLRPQQVVVSSSNTADHEVESLRHGWPFALTILTHAGRRNAAENRNACVARLDTELVSFTDADDTMHPQRLEIISDAAARTGADMILHGCATPPDPAYDAEFGVIAPPWPLIEALPVRDARYPPINSHVTVARHLAVAYPFPENLSFERREDSEFVDQLVARGVSCAFVDLALTKYVCAGSWQDAPDGSGAYDLGRTATLGRAVMSLPLLNAAKRPVQRLWRSLPLNVRQRFLK